MTTVTSGVTGIEYDAEEWALRVDLAAAFRLAVQFDWHESVGNHFSAAVSADGATFLLNPRWRHFSTIRASDLLRLDAADAAVMQRDDAPDPSAWCIHGRLHAALPQARVLLHCHPPHATALCGLKDPSIKPIDQCTARFYNRVAVDTDFGGPADEVEEGERLARAMGNHSVMLMGNHGVAVTGATVAEAFDDLYFLERAARTMVLAYSTGQPLNVMDEALAEKTAASWNTYRAAAFPHFAYLRQTLDRSAPDYKD